MANALGIVNQQQAPIDEEKLRILCSQQNVWDHLGSIEKLFRRFQKRNRSRWFENFTLITYQTYLD